MSRTGRVLPFQSLHPSGETHGKHVAKPMRLSQVLTKCYEEDKIGLNRYLLQTLRVLLYQEGGRKGLLRGGDIYIAV